MELELDGKKVDAKPGSTILEVALKEGKYIPHFCYHKKLSIAANCRMCLVEVEKSAKPLPACATPITEGMKIQTASKMAIEAQNGVMEFLLINHPLDCPICDQGGECQLQDLSVGYGRSATRFEEEKRAVTNKELGPLVSTEMTRCIHCSRCVRFTDEIAGYQELGMSYRNNHVEVMPFIGKTVNSEISGNIIDICPVGALTSKPFRHKYRSWELSRRKTIAPHDGLGSNTIAQVDKYHKIVRVLPLENETVNECWLSDRDRFSYEGLYHEERVTDPMIKQDGKWQKVDWETALNYTAKGIKGVIADHGSDAVGVLASPTSTTEEMYLLQKLMRNINVKNIDHRLGQNDFALDGKQSGIAYLGGSLEEFVQSKSFFVIGSVIREEQPLLAHRIRKAVKQGAELNVLNFITENLLCKVKNQVTADPREFAYFLAQVVKASGSSGELDLSAVEVTEQAKAIAASLTEHKGFIVIGEAAKSLPNYSEVVVLAQQLAKNIEGKYGVLAGRANEVGAGLVGFVPYQANFGEKLADKGMNVEQMLENPRKAYVLLNTELEQDVYNSGKAINALLNAETVIAMTAFINEKMKEYADVILPVTPYTETAGSYVNMQGMWQTFNGVTKPLGDSKPGWKVIRVLANQLLDSGYEYNNIEEVRSELASLKTPEELLNNNVSAAIKIAKPELNGLVRFGIQGIYNIDSITRRAESLQQTFYAKLPVLSVNSKLAAKLGLTDNQGVKVKQENVNGKFNLVISNDLPDSVVLFASNQATSGFAGRFDTIEINA